MDFQGFTRVFFTTSLLRAHTAYVHLCKIENSVVFVFYNAIYSVLVQSHSTVRKRRDEIEQAN